MLVILSLLSSFELHGCVSGVFSSFDFVRGQAASLDTASRMEERTLPALVRDAPKPVGSAELIYVCFNRNMFFRFDVSSLCPSCTVFSYTFFSSLDKVLSFSPPFFSLIDRSSFREKCFLKERLSHPEAKSACAVVDWVLQEDARLFDSLPTYGEGVRVLDDKLRGLRKLVMVATKVWTPTIKEREVFALARTDIINTFAVSTSHSHASCRQNKVME
jgi:hypothetical protein